MQKMESRYETIVNLGDEFLTLVRVGIIPIHLTTYKVVYEAYKKQLAEQIEKPQAVKKIAVEYDLQLRQVYRIIKYMEFKSQKR